MLSFMFKLDVFYSKLILIKLFLLNKLSILVYTRQYVISFDYYTVSRLTNIQQDLYTDTVIFIRGI